MEVRLGNTQNSIITETLKTRSSIVLINPNRSLLTSFDAKSSLKIDVYKSSGLLKRWEHRHAVESTERFLSSRRKGLLQHTADNEVSALARLTFYENLLIGREVSVVRINGRMY